MTDWIIEALPFLEQNDYEKIIKTYEEIIENNPDEITNYWYLGLAYLLNGQEEEAQTIWFMPLMEVDEQFRNDLQQSLLAILGAEAQRQENNKSYQLSWLIRQHIREIEPELIENLLHLVKLDFHLQTFNNTNLTEWGIIELVKKSPPDTINNELLENLLREILNFPTFESVDFAESVLFYAKGANSFIDIVFIKARYIANEENFKLYATDLIKLCLKYKPNDLFMLKELFWYYAILEKYEELNEIGNRFYNQSQTTIQKVFGSYQLVYTSMLQGDWLQAISLTENHKFLLRQLVCEQQEIHEQFISDSFIIICQPLLYIDDKPRENRSIINQISALFQQNFRSTNCCPVSFPLNLSKQPIRKLRIGYIGHSLKRHSVGWLSRWLIHYHNREEFFIALYFLIPNNDEIQKKWFRDKADLAIKLPNDVKTIVSQIQKDEIDILIDLDSFTLNITCCVMALKPAPIQVSWLGMDSTGLPAIDYFIADPYVLPEDAQDYYQEKIWRLPHTYLAVDGFEIDVPTLTREDLEIPQDAVIYFNVQGALKRNPDYIHLQMKILKEVPNSYLLIKGTGKPEILKELFTTIACIEGVEPSRLRFLERTPTEAIHRANLQIADVVLDTYPYNGATTTLETLWMGIPLVTRVGEQFAARNSYGFMMNAGINEGIAYSDEEYVEWGVKLGTNEELRQQINWKLRQSRQTSPLWKGKQFTREIEKAYQQMWEIYVNSQ